MKNLLDLCIGTLAGATFGFVIATGESVINISVESSSLKHRAFFMYLAFQTTSATIVSGAMAERTSIPGYAVISFAMSSTFALAVKFTWSGGFLSQAGYHDFAGSGVVHALGGYAAIAGAYVVGPRVGRWDRELVQQFVPHSVPSVVSGVLMLWVSGYGFNAGSSGARSTDEHARTASHAALTTALAGCAGGLTAVSLSIIKGAWSERDLRAARDRLSSLSFRVDQHSARMHDILALSNGILAGLVAITAGCDCVNAYWALLIGGVGALACDWGVRLRTWLEIDDIVDAFAVHGAAGTWGVLAVGLCHYQHGLLLGGGGALLGAQVLGVLVLAPLGLVPMRCMQVLTTARALACRCSACSCSCRWALCPSSPSPSA